MRKTKGCGDKSSGQEKIPFIIQREGHLYASVQVHRWSSSGEDIEGRRVSAQVMAKLAVMVRCSGLISRKNNRLSISDATAGSELNRNKGPRYLEHLEISRGARTREKKKVGHEKDYYRDLLVDYERYDDKANK